VDRCRRARSFRPASARWRRADRGAPQVVERDDQTREREARSERFFDARRQEQQAAREQASQTRAAREQECQSLRSQLSQLQLGGRFFRNDAAGERVYYSDSELEAARQRLAARISQVCN